MADRYEQDVFKAIYDHEINNTDEHSLGTTSSDDENPVLHKATLDALEQRGLIQKGGRSIDRGQGYKLTKKGYDTKGTLP